MIDAGDALKNAYWNFFQGLTDEGKIVSVYNNMAPSGAEPPYIILDGWVPSPDNTKTSFGQKGQFSLQVIDRMHDSVYSEVRTSRIANKVTKKLKPTPTVEPMTVEGFTHWTVVNALIGRKEPNNVDVVYRKIITVEHTLCQL